MTVIKVNGMSCSHCTSAVQEALEKLDGTKSIVVSLDKGEVRLGGDTSRQLACDAIEAVGFETG